MSKIKKILCMLLVCAMVIVPCSVFGSVSAQTDDSEPLTVEVTTDKSSYTAYGIAEITVKVTNTSDDTVNNISAEAVFSDLAPVGKNNETFKEIESLKSGESFNFSYKATVNASKVKINFFEKIILWFVRLFNGGYTATSHNIEANTENITEIKFGKYVAENVVKVRCKNSTENNNTNETQKELNNIAQLNNGKMPDITMNSEYDVPSFIAGKYSNMIVMDFESAIDSLNDIKHIMKIDDPENEFIAEKKVKIGSETQFKLQQVYKDIPVYGNTITITTNEKGNIECLNGHYIPNISIDTEPTLTENEVINIVKEKYNVVKSNGLVIYGVTGYTPTLVYEIVCSGLKKLYVSATNGNIVSSSSTINTISTTGTDLLGITREFETYQKNSNVYLLTDLTRGITIYDDNNSTTSKEVENLENGDDILQHTSNVTSKNNTWSSESVQLMYAVKNAVDFYKENNSVAFESDNLTNIIVVKNFSQNYLNAFSYTDKNDLSTTYLVIGDGKDYSRAYDVIYHELTHSIIVATCNLEYLNQSGAINEAYADILGNIIENKDDINAWVMGEDMQIGGTIRSLHSPNTYNQPEEVNGDFMHAYCYENHDHKDCDNGGVHTNSGIINKAAYNIYRFGIQDKAKLAKLFVTSMKYMDSQSSFLDCKAALIRAANSLDFSEAEKNIIRSAFDRVGIVSDKGTFSAWVENRSTGTPIEGVEVSIYLESEKDKSDKNIYTYTTNENGAIKATLPVGNYIADFTYGEQKAQTTFTIEKDVNYILQNPVYLDNGNEKACHI